MSEATASVEEDKASQGQREAPRVIAVDGSAASGKSTIGRRLAELLGYPFLDTGIMYRAITSAALDRGIPLDDEERMPELANSLRMEVRLAPPGSGDGTRVLIDGEDVTGKLRLPEVEDGVSVASGVAGVREALVRLQREIAGKQPVVMAGRDIGTVVLPDADLKVYLDASLPERARRRYEEFAGLDREVTEEMVQKDLRRRDRLDSQRAVSPLRPAGDAVVIDTDGLGQDEVLSRVLELAGISR